ncbi:sporulation protein [Microcoleus sp. FACHB-1515]|uniref:sporulation protein n=1 Tax=Cyanophyceae TaxID=3028117 RepID=UPI0016859A4C|nr:sporulation protein [Microcoleus sp. FACHB-1515]MBD2090092.1 sporulation protein [Microcoleus sp. FACHB-1515]
MSTFKKLLASVGIGAATVDTCLVEAAVPGEILSGEVYVTGGDVTQEIEKIYLQLATKYKRERGDSTYYERCVLLKHQLNESFTIQPREQKVFSIALPIPRQTPLTIAGQEVYIRTGLDIPLALDPKDWDAIAIQPHPLMRQVFDALDLLGFQLYKSDCEYHPRLGKGYPFVQELEFKSYGKYQRQLDELEVIFALEARQLVVYLEIDRRANNFAGWLNEAFDMDESYDRLYVNLTDLNQSVRHLANEIERVLQKHLR